MADEQKQVITYRQGLEASRRLLFKSWLIGALGAAVALLVSGSRDWQTIVTTMGTGGSVGFVASSLMERRLK